jgi:hypothetical protein
VSTRTYLDSGGTTSVSSGIPTLPRVCTWEEWEASRAARRKLVMQITGGKILRRRAGKPRKDILLRRLNNGERGLPFRPLISDV